MDKQIILQLLGNEFAKLKFRKNGRVFWLDLNHIQIYFECRFSAWSRMVIVDVGVWFKEMGDSKNKLGASNCHLTHNLTNIMMKLGFKFDTIDALLQFGNIEAAIVKSNIEILFQLMETKLLPYLFKFDDYEYLHSHFANDIQFQPFFVLYHHPDFFSDFFQKHINQR